MICVRTCRTLLLFALALSACESAPAELSPQGAPSSTESTSPPASTAAATDREPPRTAARDDKERSAAPEKQASPEQAKSASATPPTTTAEPAPSPKAPSNASGEAKSAETKSAPRASGREPVATDYDDRCMSDDECTTVSAAKLCEQSCACVGVPLNERSAQAYRADRAAYAKAHPCEQPRPALRCRKCPPSTVVCQEGRCKSARGTRAELELTLQPENDQAVDATRRSRLLDVAAVRLRDCWSSVPAERFEGESLALRLHLRGGKLESVTGAAAGAGSPAVDCASRRLRGLGWSALADGRYLMRVEARPR